MHRRSVLKGLVAASAVTSALSHWPGTARAMSGAKHHTIEIKGLVFDPANLVVRPGDKITWVNMDIVDHTATATDGSWDTGTLENGREHTLTVTNGMSGEYFCQLHPSMTAKLDVAEG